jgi:hypothetical protein
VDKHVAAVSVSQSRVAAINGDNTSVTAVRHAHLHLDAACLHSRVPGANEDATGIAKGSRTSGHRDITGPASEATSRRGNTQLAA